MFSSRHSCVKENMQLLCVYVQKREIEWDSKKCERAHERDLCDGREKKKRNTRISSSKVLKPREYIFRVSFQTRWRRDVIRLIKLASCISPRGEHRCKFVFPAGNALRAKAYNIPTYSGNIDILLSTTRAVDIVLRPWRNIDFPWYQVENNYVHKY